MVMYFEYDHFVREIFTDGRQHTPDLNPTWMGEALGKWDGDTLVVDTIGFNDKTWLDYSGHPHSDALHVVERIRRVNHGTLVNDITIEDPKAYTKPWVSHMVFDLHPDWKIEETICEDDVNFSNVQKVSESKQVAETRLLFRKSSIKTDQLRLLMAAGLFEASLSFQRLQLFFGTQGHARDFPGTGIRKNDLQRAVFLQQRDVARFGAERREGVFDPLGSLGIEFDHFVGVHQVDPNVMV